METGRLEVEQVFSVSFVDGVIVWGEILDGHLTEGDDLVLERHDEAIARGVMTGIDLNDKGLGAGRVGIVVAGPLVEMVAPGDVIAASSVASEAEMKQSG